MPHPATLLGATAIVLITAVGVFEMNRQRREDGQPRYTLGQKLGVTAFGLGSAAALLLLLP